MKRFLAIIVVLAIAAAAFFFWRGGVSVTVPQPEPTATTSPQAVSVVAQGLEIPWDIAFLPGGELLVTERTGDVLRIDPRTGEKKTVFNVPGQRGEGGLLGIVLHPDFERNSFVYLYMTATGANGETTNRVVRYTYKIDAFTQDRVIIADIPGAIYHDGGRIEFGPPTSCLPATASAQAGETGQSDCYLYITTGDATRSKIAQDINSLGGKILRLKDDGSIPSDNPFGNAVYSYGHRNPQGLAWDASGRLWETEHGRSGVTSGMDEINVIEKGGNYGWPDIEGDATQVGMRKPALNSGADDTWAPASALYLDGSLYFGGLRGEALYEAVLDGARVRELKEHLKGEYGRLRTVRLGPDGMLYVTTSNRDSRGNPAAGDDKILRIDPKMLN